MPIPSKPIGQDPVSQQLFYISKQLEQLIGIAGRIAGSTTTTTSTSTSTSTSTTTSTTTTAVP
jgi:hypothetical protein